MVSYFVWKDGFQLYTPGSHLPPQYRKPLDFVITVAACTWSLKSSKRQHQVVVFLEIGEWMVVLSWMVALQNVPFCRCRKEVRDRLLLGQRKSFKVWNIHIHVYIWQKRHWFYIIRWYYYWIIVGEIVLEICWAFQLTSGVQLKGKMSIKKRGTKFPTVGSDGNSPCVICMSWLFTNQDSNHHVVIQG